MQLVCSTEAVVSAKRFDAWREGVCERYVNVDMARTFRSDNVGYIKEAAFGPVTLTECLAPPQHIIRRKSNLSKVDKDCFYIGLPLHGCQQVDQRGISVTCGNGRASVFYASEPYELRNGTSAKAVWLEFPRSELLSRVGERRLPATEALVTTRGIGRIIGTMASTLVLEAEGLAPDTRTRMGAQLLDFVAMACDAVQSDPASSLLDGNVKAARLREIQNHIEANLSDSLLNPERIARASQMSVRALHYLFKSTGVSVSEYIWRRRIDRCRQEIEFGILTERSLTDIAMAAGFNSLSHFSSMFRKRFGIPPTDLRRRQAP